MVPNIVKNLLAHRSVVAPPMDMDKLVDVPSKAKLDPSAMAAQCFHPYQVMFRLLHGLASKFTPLLLGVVGKELQGVPARGLLEGHLRSTVWWTTSKPILLRRWLPSKHLFVEVLVLRPRAMVEPSLSQ